MVSIFWPHFNDHILSIILAKDLTLLLSLFQQAASFWKIMTQDPLLPPSSPVLPDISESPFGRFT
jgi:hypothetical protein